MADSTVTIDLTIDTSEAQASVNTLASDIKNTIASLNNKGKGQTFEGLKDTFTAASNSLSIISKQYAELQNNFSKPMDNTGFSNLTQSVVQFEGYIDSLEQKLATMGKSIASTMPNVANVYNESGLEGVQSRYIGKNAYIADMMKQFESLCGVVAETRQQFNDLYELWDQARTVNLKYNESGETTTADSNAPVKASDRIAEIRAIKQAENASREKAEADEEAAIKSERAARKAARAQISAMSSVVMKIRGYTMLLNEISKPFTKLWEYTKKVGTVAASVAKTGLSSLATGFKNLASNILKSVTHLKKYNTQTQKSKKNTQSLLVTLLKAVVGFRSLYLFLRKMVGWVKDGLSNMSQFTKQSNTTTTALLTLSAKFTQLKNSVAAAIAPIITALTPVLTKIADLFTKAANAIAHFWAALTGQKTYLKALTLGAKDAAGATKDLNKQLSGLDILNNMTTNKSSSGTTANDMFEVAEVENKWDNFISKIKDIASKLWTPIKKAWNLEGQGVLDAWKFALGSIYSLIKQIAKDFLTMWNEDATVAMLQNVLKIIRNIGWIIAFIAQNLKYALQYNSNGLKIWEALRDIVAIVVKYIEQATGLLVDWAKSVNLKPLVNSFRIWLESLIPIADNVFGIIFDSFKTVFMGMLNWFVQPGADKPASGLQGIFLVLYRLNNAVDWEKLRANFNKLWNALEPFMETVGEGLILFFDYLLQRLASFINGDYVANVFDKIAEFLDSVTNMGSTGVNDFLKEVYNYIDEVKSALWEVVKSVWPIVKEMIKYLIDHKDELVKFINKIAQFFTDNKDLIVSTLQSIATAIGEIFNFFVDHGDTIISVIKFLVDHWKGILELAAAFKVLTTVASTFLTVWSSIKLIKTAEITGNLASSLTTMSNTATNTAKNIATDMSGELAKKGLFSGMVTTFKESMGALKLEGVTGIKAVWQSLTTATDLGTLTSSFAGIGLTIASSVVTAFAGAEVGKKLGSMIFPTDAELYEGYSGITGTVSLIKDFIVGIGDTASMTWSNLFGENKKQTENVANYVSEAAAKSSAALDEVNQSYKDGTISADEYKNKITEIITESNLYANAADSVKESINKYLDKSKPQEVIDKFSELESKVQNTTTTVNSTNDTLAESSDKVKSSAEDVMSVLESQSASAEVTQKTAEYVDELVNAYNSEHEILSENNMTYDEHEAKLKELQEQLNTNKLTQEEFNNAVKELDTAFQGNMTGVEELLADYASLFETTESAEEALQSFKDLFTGEGGIITTLKNFSDSLTGENGVNKSMETVKKSTEGVGESMTKNLSNEITKGSGDVKKSTEDMCKNVTDIVTQSFQIEGGKSNVAEDWGKALGIGLTNGLVSAVNENLIPKLNEMITTISNAMQNMINTVNTGINTMTNSLNNFGTKLNNYQIQNTGTGYSVPHLATGSVVPPNKEFLAVLGDNKTETEVVSPLSTIKQAMSEVISGSNLNNNSNNDSSDIVIQIDGSEVFRAVRKQSSEYTKRTGDYAFS